MIPFRPVTGVSAQPVQPKPFGTIPARSMDTLQRHDVFFSDNSYRSQLKRFLSRKGQKRLMFSFAQQEAGFWDVVLPNVPRDLHVILVQRP